MKRQDILKNICFWDMRNPECAQLHGSQLPDSKSEEEGCQCGNCADGKTKLALAMLDMSEMVCRTNCLLRMRE
jgi:phage-related protein